jgi:pyrophosphatase PpaX
MRFLRKMKMSDLRYDLVLYDLDGTLTDSIPLIMDSFRYAYEAFPELPPRTDDDLMSYIGKPLETSFEVHDEETAKILLERYLDYNHRRLWEGDLDLFEGIPEALSKIRDMGVKQGIVTAKRKYAAMITIEKKGLDGIIDGYVFGDDGCKAKPAGDPVIEGARRLGVTDMSRVLYVGDALPDILCARNAGCDFAFVSWSKMPEGEKSEIRSLLPEYEAKVPEDLSCIIRDSEL